MNLNRVLAVLRREFQEILKSRGLLLAIFLPPLFITVLPLVGVAALGHSLTDSGSARGIGQFGLLLQSIPDIRSWTEGEVAVFIILQQVLTFFLLMPLIISLSIAAQSIVGEKQNKSLEPLLATPVKTGELLFAKSLTALIPAILATWVSFVIFLVGGRFLIPSDRVFAALLNPKWLVAMVILAPLLALLSVNIAVILSSRVNDTRAVQQIGGFIVMPIVLIGVAQTTGIILLNVTSFVIGSVAVAAVDAIILRIGVRLFQREKILTQWK
jgi:ABC-type Na+ efflux pump permease subunit